MTALFGKKKIEENKEEAPKAAVVKSAKVKKEKPKAAGVKKHKIEKKEFSSAWRALQHPLVTEKSTNLSVNYNQYVFKVDKSTNKNQVRQAIQDLYGVKVERVNILKVRPKEKKVGRYVGHTAGYKKAMVLLAAGEKIDSGG